MAKKLIYLVLIIVFSSCTNTSNKKDNVEVEKRKEVNNKSNEVQMHPEVLLEKKVEISLTADFVRMSDNEIKNIYPEPKRRPDVIFRNPDGTANISLQHTKKRALISELPEVLEQLSSQYKNNPSIEFINSRIESINGQDYVVLEFISQGENKKVYNLMLVTSLHERVMMCAFTCAMPVITEWKVIGNNLIRSIRIL